MLDASEMQGMEILELDSFEVPRPMSKDQEEKYRRRFLTLFIPAAAESGRGGSGMVIKVRNAEGEAFAMKRIVGPNRNEMDESMYHRRLVAQRTAFRKEFENQQLLSEMKGFPKVYGYGMVGDDPLIIMEWVEGKTLSRAAELRSADPEKKQVEPLVVAQLGAAIYGLISRFEYLDDSFAHRDISPNNIMLCEDVASIENQMESGDYDLRLIDFGSATMLAHFGDPTFTTMAGVIRKATPEYAPPEMLSNDLPNLDKLRQSSLIDVYAIGSVLYELMCGETPYRLAKLNHDPQSYYRYKLEHAVPQPLSVHSGLSSVGALGNRPVISSALNEALAQGYFDQKRFIESVNVVDAQLGFILMKSLQVEQEKRAHAWEMKDMLDRFVRNYAQNILRYYNGENLIPFIDVDSVPKKPMRVVSLGASSAPVSNTVLRVAYEPDKPGSYQQDFQVPQTNDARKMLFGMPQSRAFAWGAAGVVFAISLAFALIARGQPGVLHALGRNYAVTSSFTVCFLGCFFPAGVAVPFYMLGSNSGQKMFLGSAVMVAVGLVVWGFIAHTDWVVSSMEPMWSLALAFVVLVSAVGAWLSLDAEEE